MSSADISALVALITNAAKTVEEQFKSSSKPFVPSLDDTRSHPFDTEIPSMTMEKAIQTIEGACAQLCATVARPNHTVLNKCMGHFEPECINIVVTFKIPDILQEKPAGMHVNELGQKTGLEVGKLGRLLRFLATKHFFREVAPNVFANNRLSLQLLSANPLTNLCQYMTEETNKSLNVLAETLSDPVWGHSFAPEHAPFHRWSNTTMWKYYEGSTPEGRVRGARFGVAMSGWNTATQSNAVVKNFPWGDLPHGSSVCDVGGGVGHIIIQLAKIYPTLKLKLQDTPERIVQAQTQVWPAQCPKAIEEGRIEFKAMDFLVESPIKDCDVYFLKNIVHNWADKEVLQILRGIRNAMKPSSRLLMHEYVIQHLSRVPDDISDIVQAPEPLLPNYGVGGLRPYSLDINMMVMLNSRERSLEESTKLAAEVGLQFVSIWDVGETYVMEFRVAV